VLGLPQSLALHRPQAFVALHEFGKAFLLGGGIVGTGSSSNIARFALCLHDELNSEDALHEPLEQIV
jgi:hypothetical protein